MIKDPKKTVRDIADQVGKQEARRLLVVEGISTSMADKLVADRYGSEVRQLVRQAIGRALEAAKKMAG